MRDFTRSFPCPICHGGADMPRGKGVRCNGGLSDDGYAHCSREEYAGAAPADPSGRTWNHRLAGDCKCGRNHGEAIAQAAPVVDPKKPIWVPVLPVPDEALAPILRHYKHGGAMATWPYPDEAGRLLCIVARYHTGEVRPDGKPDKTFLPWTWCEDTNPATAKPPKWQQKGIDHNRPLFNLPGLAARPAAPVLLVEGEKTAEAAAAKYPDMVVITNLNGSAGPNKTDWAPLAGREVIAWRDADAPGEKWLKAVVANLRLARAAMVRAVTVPVELPEGWDLADPWPVDVPGDPAGLIDTAPPAAGWGSAELDPGADQGEAVKRQANGYSFEVDDTGTRRIARGDNGERKAMKLCGPLHILAGTSDMQGENHGVLLEWTGRDGRTRQWAMPMRLLGSENTIRERLLSGGLYVNPARGAMTYLAEYLQSEVAERRLCADRVGWHGETFVLPDEAFGPEGGQVIMQADNPPPIKAAGTLAEWQATIGKWCHGNTRAGFAACVGFATPLLQLTGEENGGFHFRGASSTGKTSVLAVAASVWGPGWRGNGGYIEVWRTTGNGLEARAAGRNGCLLILDDLGQLDPREAGDAVYLLGNGTGKGRAGRTGEARTSAGFQLLYLSSGEIDLAGHMRQAGRQARGGQEVRFADIPVDTGAGTWEHLHGMESPAALSDAFRQAAQRHYGTPIRAFLSHLAQRREEWPALRDAIDGFRRKFAADHVPAGSTGEVTRVAARFAYVAAAGVLAVQAGILPWPEDEPEQSAAACFAAWLENRGTLRATDATNAADQVRMFLVAHGSSRFAELRDGDFGREEVVRDARINDQAGFKKQEGDAWVYYVFRDQFRKTVCAGFDWRATVKELDRRGALLRSNEKTANGTCKPLWRRHFPGMGYTHAYAITLPETEEA